MCCRCYYYIVTSSMIYYTNIRQHGICLSYMVKIQKVVNGDVFHASVLREMIIKYQSKSMHNSANDKCRENIKIYSSCHLIDSCRKEMSILRLKAVIVTILIFLLPHHNPNGLLTSVITLAFTGKQLSPFTVFTLLLGLTLIRETFCYNLSMSMQSVADAKVALDPLQIFLEIRGSRRVAKAGGV